METTRFGGKRRAHGSCGLTVLRRLRFLEPDNGLCGHDGSATIRANWRKSHQLVSWLSHLSAADRAAPITLLIAQAYMLSSMPTASLTILGAFQVIRFVPDLPNLIAAQLARTRGPGGNFTEAAPQQLSVKYG